MNQLFNCIFQQKNNTPWKSIHFEVGDLSISNTNKIDLPKRNITSKCLCLNILNHNIIITPQLFTEYSDNIIFKETKFNKIYDIDSINVSCFENINFNQNDFLAVNKSLFDFKIPQLGSECIIDYDDELCISGHLTQINHNRQYISSLIIPFLNIKSDIELDAKMKYSLIGSSLINNDKIIGFVISVNNNDIICVPIYVLVRMIQNKIINNGYYILPCNCNIIKMQHENSTIDGVQIQEIYKNFGLVSNNILYKINGISINHDATIYDKELCINIDFNTYITLLCKSNVKISYFIDSEDEFISYEKNIILSNINDIMKIKPKTKEFINYKGLYICELSDEILNHISNNSSVEYCIKNNINHFGTNNSKYIVLFDTNNDNKFSQFIMKINIIKCVDNQEINTINEFVNMCQNGKQHTILYSFNGVDNDISI